MEGESIGQELGDGVVRKGDKSQCEYLQQSGGSYAEMAVDITWIYPDGTYSSPPRCPAGVRRDLAPQEAPRPLSYTRRD
jgi:hypothetical protein